MPRDSSAKANALKSRASQLRALDRTELRQPSSPRIAPFGVTSFPVKKMDSETEAAIQRFLDRGTTTDSVVPAFPVKV